VKLGPAPRLVITELVKAYGETTIASENAAKMLGIEQEFLIKDLTDGQLLQVALCQAHDYINRQSTVLDALRLKYEMDASRSTKPRKQRREEERQRRKRGQQRVATTPEPSHHRTGAPPPPPKKAS
jgi:ribosomal protein S13